MPTAKRPRPATRVATDARAAGAPGLALMLVLGCGLDDGERFGRAGASAGVLRVHVPSPVGEVDPPRARAGLDRAVALQLFATLVAADGSVRLASQLTNSADGRTVTVMLRPEARFSDGTPLDADTVVWSWRRALLRSTGTLDVTPLWAIANGRELAEGRLLQIAHATVGRPAPFTRLGEAPANVPAVELPPGSMVRVLDTNERRPCCGGSVALRREPDAGDALGVLHANDVGTVIGARTVRDRSFLLMRSPNGASGWAEQGLLATHVSPASLVRVVDRGDGSAGLRVGPDQDAPVREALADDAVVEVLGETEGWLHAVDMRSGQMGFIQQRAIEALRGERQWMLVQPERDPSGATDPVWVPLRALAFNPSALGARAIDSVTLELDCAGDVDAVLRALAHPAMAPVPPQAIAAHGRAWTAAANIVTSGPFSLAPPLPGRTTLVRSPTALERERARLERVELVAIDNPISALHLYRAGELDVLLTVPADLAPRLARAADFAPSASGGGLIAPEVKGLSIDAFDLRGVEVAAP